MHFFYKEILHINTVHLDRQVIVDVLLPPDYATSNLYYKVLYLNDGQDLEQLRLAYILSELLHRRRIQPIVVVAIHANSDRHHEYGTAVMTDYKKRGGRSGAYSLFVTTELIPLVCQKYRVLLGAANTVIAGCSLGGLSAFDMAWRFPEWFGKTGVFSGAFWWRSKDLLDPNYTDQDRIMHRVVRNSLKREGLKFWFQTGTWDEIDDRNQNGIIDSIDDTLDLIAELRNKRYSMGVDIRYVQIDGGRHDQQTWAVAMPDFLKWAFGKDAPDR